MPKYAVVLMIFTLGAIGLPGTSGFIGEFLILIGTFKKNFLVATIASLGVILAAAYMLWLYKRVIFGKLINDDLKKMVDLKKSEIFILWSLAIPTLLFGFYPEPLINTIEVSVTNLIDTYNLNIEIYLAKNN
jgi:NADH-quinone oxidoreductase subunit M